MGTYSNYPDEIDSTTELPLATDNITPVTAEVVNRLRDAVVCIEQELGVQPSGIYSTVRARLDAMDLTSGGGGGGLLAVDYDNVNVLPLVTDINFTGSGVSVASAGDNKVTVTVIGGAAGAVQESLAEVFNGQTSFTLTELPSITDTVQMYLNGIKQKYGTEYVVSSNVVTYTGSIPLATGDQVEFWYLIGTSSGSGSGGSGSVAVKDEGIVVDSATTVLNFVGNVAATEVSPGNVQVTVPGLLVKDDGYSIDSSVNTMNFTGTGVTATQTSSGVIQIDVSGLLVKDDGYSVDSNVTTLNFTTGITATQTSSGVVQIAVPGLLVKDDGYVVDSAVNTINFTGLGVTATQTSSGIVQVDVPFLVTVSVTNINNTNSPYTAISTDYLIAANSTSGAITVNLPASPSTGRTLQVKDLAGTAATNNITINGNGANIDSAASYVMIDNYESITVTYTGARWSIV